MSNPVLIVKNMGSVSKTIMVGCRSNGNVVFAEEKTVQPNSSVNLDGIPRGQFEIAISIDSGISDGHQFSNNGLLDRILVEVYDNRIEFQPVENENSQTPTTVEDGRNQQTNSNQSTQTNNQTQHQGQQPSQNQQRSPQQPSQNHTPTNQPQTQNQPQQPPQNQPPANSHQQQNQPQQPPRNQPPANQPPAQQHNQPQQPPQNQPPANQPQPQQQPAQGPTQQKDPTTAALLSFLMPGLGQIINGEAGRGIGIWIGCTVGWIIGIVTLKLLIGFVIIPIVVIFQIWQIIDAKNRAEKINRGEIRP